MVPPSTDCARTPAQVKAFLADHRISYPSFYDPDGELLQQFPNGTLNPGAVPSTIVLDRQGRIAARALNGPTYSVSSSISPVASTV